MSFPENLQLVFCRLDEYVIAAASVISFGNISIEQKPLMPINATPYMQVLTANNITGCPNSQPKSIIGEVDVLCPVEN